MNNYSVYNVCISEERGGHVLLMSNDYSHICVVNVLVDIFACYQRRMILNPKVYVTEKGSKTHILQLNWR